MTFQQARLGLRVSREKLELKGRRGLRVRRATLEIKGR
jgi:hypothetical protein